MTKPTGRPPGRPKGAANKASWEARERAAAAGLLPHEFLLSVVRGEQIGGYVPSFAERLDAAKAAAPFYASKLSAVEATVITKPLSQITDAELEALIEMEAAPSWLRSGRGGCNDQADRQPAWQAEGAQEQANPRGRGGCKGRGGGDRAGAAGGRSKATRTPT